MIVDLAQEESVATIETDIAIIGSGPAGASLAAHLKRDCCVIESGGPSLDIENHWRFHSVNAGARTKVDSLRVRGIGGASLRWTGRCIPLDPYDFEDRPWISDTSWPLKYDDLADWIDRSDALMGLQSAQILDEFPATQLGEAMQRDGRWRETIWRFAESKRRGVFRFGRDLALAFQGERRHLFYHAHCAQILTDENRVKGLFLVSENGRQVLVRARHFVIAAGCVESARLLLDTHRANPALLDHVSRWLGRGFHQHLRVDAGVLKADRATARALQQQIAIFRRGGVTQAERGFALDPDFARREKIGNASLVLRYEGRGEPGLRDLAGRLGSRLLGRPPVVADPDILVEIDTEQSITAESRIDLDESLDPLGRPRARIHWTISETDCRTAFVAAQAFSQFAEGAGLGALELAPGLEPGRIDDAIRRDANHQLGGTRMSTDPADGVVDRDLTVHGVDNLSVVGGSVFSTGGHANPTQTIVALALRLADHLDAKV